MLGDQLDSSQGVGSIFIAAAAREIVKSGVDKFATV